MRITAAFIVATLAVCGQAKADEITMMADLWCPYNCEPDSEESGFLVEIAKDALEAKGHKFKYTLSPWERSLASARESKTTGVVGAGPADAEGLVLSEPMAENSNCFFVPKSSQWSFSGLSSLEKVTIGAIVGYTYNDEIDAYLKDSKNAKRVDLVSGDDAIESNLKKLASSRLNVVIEDRYVANYVMNKIGIGDKIQMAECTTSSTVHVGFNEKHPKAKEYVQIVNEHYASLKKSGKIADLLTKYRMN